MQAYDSTVLFFDDAIPPPRDKLLADPTLLYSDDDFYALYSPVFERNLRFDARLRPDVQSKLKNSSAKRKSFQHSKPPLLGDATTPINEVHKFYEYWIHFESWRDFSAQAADELEVENDLENAESRYEKRWIQQQIDKRAKQLKKAELNRIQMLVERAMEADPRLRQERQAEKLAKERARQERLEELERKKLEELRKQQEEEAAIEAEKLAKQQEKQRREEHKKRLRMARQQLRRMSSDSFCEGVWQDEYDMEQDVEFLCTRLSLEELNILNEIAKEKQGIDCLTIIKTHVEEVKMRASNVSRPAADEGQDQDPFSKDTTDNVNKVGNKKAINIWTSQELSALAKAVKKYPGAGANRWDLICSYINASCQQQMPRTREECIEKFNQVARQSSSESKDANNMSDSCAAVAKVSSPSSEGWTVEQDQQLQEGLTRYPASMDKNERWTAIAKCVTGKTKKDCVERFKAIRDAIKSKNSTT